MTEYGDAPGPGRPGPTGDALTGLRDAVAALPRSTDAAEDFDVAEHATRFEAVHDALVAVLADVDRT